VKVLDLNEAKRVPPENKNSLDFVILNDAESKIAHETTDALTLSGHARTPSGCKSGDIKRTFIKKRVLPDNERVSRLVEK
jgi:hypothetical protein